MGCAYGMGGMGAWMIAFGLIAAGVLVVLVFGAIWLIRHYTSPTRSCSDPAENELRRRYAAGDIDHDEYQQRLTNLLHRTRPFY